MDLRSRGEYGLRWLAVGGLGILISVAAYLYSAALERRVRAGEFERLVHAQLHYAQDLVDHSTRLLLAYRALFRSAETVERAEFASFSRGLLAHYPEVLAMHWAPRVSQAERAGIELELRSHQRAPIGIFDVEAAVRRPVPAPVRPEYLPIRYSEPLDKSHQALGLDLLARPHNQEVVHAAAYLGEQRTSPVFSPVLSPEGPLAVAIYQPVYRPGLPLATTGQRWEALAGHLILMLRPSVLLKGLTFGHLQAEVRLFELGRGGAVAIHPRDAAMGAPSERVIHHVLAVPGRQWLLEVVAPPDFGGLTASIQPLLLMLSLLVLTFFLLLFLDRSHRDAFALQRLNRELLCRQRELDGLAHYDALTGLPNRLLLFDRIGMALGLQQRQPGRLAICLLDLDGFKEVNDRFGHQAGDRVLKEVAQRVLGVLRPSDTVARLGGDEFVVVLPRLDDEATLEGIMRRLIEQVGRPIELGAMLPAITVSASIGVAFAEAGSDANGLIRTADIAMYEAKRAGKARYRIFRERREANA